jgi:Flp pilus assembly protein TadB
MYANFLLENTNSSVLRITSGAAFAGLAATALIAVAVVPWLGAAGGLAALVLAAAVKARVLRGLLARRHPELHP